MLTSVLHRIAALSSVGCIGAFLAGCGGSEDHPPPSPAASDSDVIDLSHYDSSTADARDVVAQGTCDEGVTRDCRIYLPSHDGVQPCFVGQQTCTNAAWSPCDNAVLVDANAGDEQLSP